MKYERLTQETIGTFKYDLKDHEHKVAEFGTYDAFYDYNMAVKRLGEYEDSNLSPEQVQEIAKVKAEERLLILPCKVGDRVYAKGWNGYCYAEVDKVKWDSGEIDIENPDKDIFTVFYTPEEEDKSFIRWADRGMAGKFGETVFLSREAAEKVLGNDLNELKKNNQCPVCKGYNTKRKPLVYEDGEVSKDTEKCKCLDCGWEYLLV